MPAKKKSGHKTANMAPAYGNDAPVNKRAARTPLMGKRMHAGRGGAGVGGGKKRGSGGKAKRGVASNRKAAMPGDWNG